MTQKQERGDCTVITSSSSNDHFSYNTQECILDKNVEVEEIGRTEVFLLNLYSNERYK